MGGAGGKNAAPPLSLMSVFENACPQYMAWGMTWEQYWDGEVTAHKAYRKAKKLQVIEENKMAWIQGMYSYEAIANLSPALKAGAKGKAKPYPKQPYDLFEDERKKTEERKQRERYERMREKVSAFAKAWNQKQEESKQSEVVTDAG